MVKEGWLERRNGESAAMKKWRSLPDPKTDPFGRSDVEYVPFKFGGRMERLGRGLDEMAALQWQENKIGIALAVAFVIACLLAVGW